jgi:hypothetical protein
VFDVLGFLRVPVFQNPTKTTNMLLKTYVHFFAFGSQMKQHFISGTNFVLDFLYSVVQHNSDIMVTKYLLRR